MKQFNLLKQNSHQGEVAVIEMVEDGKVLAHRGIPPQFKDDVEYQKAVCTILLKEHESKAQPFEAIDKEPTVTVIKL